MTLNIPFLGYLKYANHVILNFIKKEREWLKQ